MCEKGLLSLSASLYHACFICESEANYAASQQFSENFTILLFHYDGRTTEWEEFEWSKRAIHVSVRKQTKW